MTPDELAVFDQLIRAYERLYGRSLTDDEIAKVAESAPEVCRKRNLRAATAWMDTFARRQATRTPDFDALYKKKADIDGRLLGDSNPYNSPKSAT